MMNISKRGMVRILKEKGYSISNVHQINLILQEMGFVVKSGNDWMTTDAALEHTISYVHCNEDIWHDSIIEAICNYLDSKGTI